MKSFTFILKLFLSVFLLGFLFFKIDATALQNLISGANGYLLLVAVIVIFAEVGLLIFAWFLILRLQGHQISYWQTYSIYVIGHFFGTFLPVNLGADIIRAYSLSKYISNATDAVSSMVTLRLSGLFSVFILVLGSPIIFGLKHIDRSLLVVLWAMFVGMLLFFIIINRFSGIQKWLGQEEKGKLHRIKSMVGGVYRSFRQSISHPLIMGSGVGLMFVVQLSRVLQGYVIGMALGAEISFYWFFVFLPIIVLVIQLPISFSGIGVREAAYVYFFTQSGVEVHMALAIALLSSAFGLIFNVSGGVLYILKNMRWLTRERTAG